MRINKKIFKYKGGFTYIEFLLYISISSVMLLVIGGVLTNILFGKAKFTIQENIVYGQYYAFEEITKAVHMSDSISIPTNTGTSSQLELAMLSETENPTQFFVLNSALYKKIGTATPEVITTPNVSVDSISFQQLPISNGNEGIRFELTLMATGTGLSVYTLYKETVTTTIFQKRTP